MTRRILCIMVVCFLANPVFAVPLAPATFDERIQSTVPWSFPPVFGQSLSAPESISVDWTGGPDEQYFATGSATTGFHSTVGGSPASAEGNSNIPMNSSGKVQYEFVLDGPTAIWFVPVNIVAAGSAWVSPGSVDSDLMASASFWLNGLDAIAYTDQNNLAASFDASGTRYLHPNTRYEVRVWAGGSIHTYEAGEGVSAVYYAAAHASIEIDPTATTTWEGDEVYYTDLFTLEFSEGTIPEPADANGDGKVDGLDYLIWAGNFGDDPAQDPPGSPENGDFNDDGVVDGLDYLVWAGNFGQGPNDSAAVPEPGSLSLLVFGCAAVAIRRRRDRKR